MTENFVKIILGSKSANRQKVLRELGFEFETMSADIDEKQIRLTDSKELTLALANAKADTLLPKINEPSILITSDQVVVVNGKICEKPENAGEARQFFKAYEEYPPETVTAVVVVNTATGKRCCGVDLARVKLKSVPQNVIEELIATGRLYNWAGGFTIREPLLVDYIDWIDGEEESVIGLPKALTLRLLADVQKI